MRQFTEPTARDREERRREKKETNRLKRMLSNWLKIEIGAKSFLSHFLLRTFKFG